MSDASSLLEVIGARISGGKNQKSFELLYKATDKPDVQEFHRKCDAKGPTVTLLYGKYNTLFGGYTSKNWSSNKNRKVKDENAFLFAKDENAGAKCIFLPIKKKKADIAITCDSNFGPTFGGGTLVNYDLQAFKKDGSPPKDKGSTPKDKESTPKDEESIPKDKYMLLNGSLNVNCAYGVERSPGDVSGAQGLGTPECDREQEKIKTKDINSGQMIVKRIEVYQVVDDELPEMWLPMLEGDEFNTKKQQLLEMEPRPELNIKQYNILLIGVIGSGKSSFINTLSTVFSRKVAQVAPARQSETSVTSKVKAYVLKSENGEPLNIRIFDVRGFEDERGYDDELELLLDGKLPIGYEFQDNPELNTIPEKKETKPMLDDKIHIVCFVHGNQNFETLTPQLNERFNSIKKTISRKDLPMVVVATKYDKICPKIARDIDHIYKSPKAENAALKTAAFYGVVTSHVFPVVNYVSEQETKDGIDKLALKALYEMCQLIEAHLGHHEDIVETPDDWTEREKLLPVLSNSTEKEAALVKIHDKLSELDNKKLLILMVGTVNCGKSSFIDSVSSALINDIDIKAVELYSASAPSKDVSLTEKFQLYQMKYKHEPGPLKKSNVYFGDTPGFQETEGITVDHVRFILRGNVPDRYKIINGIQETAKDFKAHPTPGDKIHVVCFIFDCVSVLNKLSYKIESTMKNMLQIVYAEGVPFIVILTKCDEVSQTVRRNKHRVFEDRKVKECKSILMNTFRFKQKKIFPVVNYVQENEVDLQADALLIAAFNEVLKIGKNKLDEIEEGVDGRHNEA